MLVEVGGEGTPPVQDFCLGEIALARSTGVMATRNVLAETVDLIHRLPRMWQVVVAGDCEPWLARKVAKLSRHLPYAVIAVVDAAIAPMLGTESAARVIEVAEAKIIEADPDLHHRRIEQERQRRYVALSRTDTAGLRTLVARIGAGEAAWVEATITRVAQILAAQEPDLSTDQARAKAFGWLARPADLLRLLLEHTGAADVGPGREPAWPSRPTARNARDGGLVTPDRGGPRVHLQEACAHVRPEGRLGAGGTRPGGADHRPGSLVRHPTASSRDSTEARRPVTRTPPMSTRPRSRSGCT